MSRWQSLASAAVFVVCIVPVTAGSEGPDPNYERVLVPLAAASTAGVHESRWTVETLFLYTGDDVVEIRPRTYICLITCVDPASRERILPGQPPRRLAISGSPGLFLYLPRRHAGQFVFQSVVFETSRASSASGTAIPVARDCEFRPSAHLLRVPLASGSRTLLRIYGVPEAVDPIVTVRYFAPLHPADPFTPVALVREETVQLRSQPAQDGLFLRPSFAAIAHVESIPELSPYDAVWIEIAAGSPGLRVWAIASVTDNGTQHVTLIAPQVPCSAP